MFRRIPDTTKIQRLIGWRPTKSLDAILADVVGERRRLSAARFEQFAPAAEQGDRLILRSRGASRR
jgi:hypothetical protein